MKFQIRKINSIEKLQAKKMFEWDADPDKFCSGPCKGPNDPPREKNWEELQSHLNSSNAHRFGIYCDDEFVGEFNFVFNHRELLKREPKTAWIGISIGDTRHRGKGAGTMAMTTIEREVLAMGGKRIELGVFEYNEPAIRLYEKLGYKRFAEIPSFTWWKGKLWSDFRFEKYLNE